MKVVVSMNEFKSSASAMDMGNACKEGILKVYNDAEIIVLPMADGGDGTTEACAYGMNAKFINDIEVTGPMGNKVKANYAVNDDKKTAIIAMSSAAGIKYVRKEDRDPMKATTYGVGELIKDALKKRYKNIILGVGGSATVEGGIGMMQALGYGMLDKEGKQVSFGAIGMRDIERIDTTNALKELKDANILILTDVRSVLCGKEGAVYLYGMQKGVKENELAMVDGWLRRYADIVNNTGKKIDINYPGIASCAGLPLPLMSLCDAKMESGGAEIIKINHIEEAIKDADIVVTGEGQIDDQTPRGKAPIQIAEVAKKYGKIVIDLSGRVGQNANKNNEAGIDAYFSIIQNVLEKDKAKDKEVAKENMKNMTEQLFRLIKVAST